MTVFDDVINQTIGPAPPGWEWADYLIKAVLLLFLLKCVYKIFMSISNAFTGLAK